MSDPSPNGSGVPVDVVIFGGGAAGLWLLDEAHRCGHRALLLEPYALGSGQTIGSQGIIHGGLKYSLSLGRSSSARSIRDMPDVWRRCLAGDATPDLRSTRRRSDYCFLWRTSSIRSRIGMAGAKAGLRVTPQSIDDDERPEVLRNVPGQVARLEEQVIDPQSMLTTLADRHPSRILSIDPAHGVEVRASAPGQVDHVLLINPATGDNLDVRPSSIVLTAGRGNDTLREQVGLDAARGQRRPLHMVMVRGDLPVLNGHCVDGNRTRITVTSSRDHANRTVWQVGGQISEDGVEMDEQTLLETARREIEDVIPGIDLSRTEWATYRVDRAEANDSRGARPDDMFAEREGNTITAWPTKLALVPKLVERILELLDDPTWGDNKAPVVSNWPRPDVAVPPWETSAPWFTID
ncbi:MAG: FAD-dependent oxidoreductase [Planctomycetota bacterium]